MGTREVIEFVCDRCDTTVKTERPKPVGFVYGDGGAGGGSLYKGGMVIQSTGGYVTTTPSPPKPPEGWVKAVVDPLFNGLLCKDCALDFQRWATETEPPKQAPPIPRPGQVWAFPHEKEEHRSSTAHAQCPCQMIIGGPSKHDEPEGDWRDDPELHQAALDAHTKAVERAEKMFGKHHDKHDLTASDCDNRNAATVPGRSCPVCKPKE